MYVTYSMLHSNTSRPKSSQLRCPINEKLTTKFRVRIDVNEMGTFAAAASAGGVSDSFSDPRVHITIDRPFLFLVHKEGNILFAGRVVDPEYFDPLFHESDYESYYESEL